MNKIRFFLSILLLSSCGNRTTANPSVSDKSPVQSTPDSEEEQSGQWIQDAYPYIDEEGEKQELPYGLYVPENSLNHVTLPLITYVPDSTYVGQSVMANTKASCIKYWLNKENMKTNPCFFLVFSFKETVTDCSDSTLGGQIVPIIDAVCKKYPIDLNRLYLTGQSMGGILDFALNDRYPDKFKATVYVGCQFGGDVHDEQYDRILNNAAFLKKKLIYIASRKDEKAPYGQDDMEKKLKEANIPYGKLYDINHNSDHLEEDINQVLNQGFDINLFGYRQLTTTGNGVGEHMQSFNKCYQISALFTWLLNQ